MQLDALSLHELNTLALHLRILTEVGTAFHDLGMDPIFGLVPGQPATIVLPAIMPPVRKQPFLIPDVSPSLPDASTVVADDAPPAADCTLSAGAEAISTGFQDPDSYCFVPGNNGGSLIVITASEPDVPTLLPGADGPDSVAAPGAETEVPPADLVAQPRTTRPDVARRWTPGEDARLVARVAELVLHRRMTKTAAVDRAAIEMDRPVQGAHFRIRSLKDALQTAMAAGVPVSAAPVPEIPPVIPPVKQTLSPQGDGGDPVGGGAVIGSAASAPADTSEPAPPKPFAKLAVVAETNDLATWYGDIAYRDGWSLARDEELMALANSGWGIPEIAMQMQIDSRLIKARWDVLTGLTTGSDGKPLRRFGSKAVSEHLTMLLAGRG